ncbi:relaxase/mobilization nuclease [Drancourtella sp. An177]|nr:relaxase/mobilization nuclease [Drancourtella sp. An177]
MAIIKHVKSHNANYSNVMDYLLFQHDPKTGVLLHNDLGQRFFREDFYKDGLNCNPDTFDIECRETNEKYKKNRRREEVKNHHYIISFDPDDVTECGLTGERAQELCMDFVRKNFPGYQAIVVTHTDGDNHSGNIHTHIVINSVRKYAVERQDYMDKPNEEKAGYKHRSTNRFLTHLKKEVMAMCEREGLHQIDLLSPSPEKITEAEFRAKSRGQEKMDKINKKITAEGLRSSATTFQTQKDFLRKAIEDCSRQARDFEEFQSLLLENYNISVISQRGRYRYLHPDRSQRITEKALGTDYGRDHLEEIFSRNVKGIRAEKEAAAYHSPETDYRKDPLAIFYYRTQLRLVVDLQANVKAMQSEAYAQKVKITNLQQMANTLIYIQEHGYDTRKDLSAVTSEAQEKLTEAYGKKRELTEKMKVLNSQIHYTGQYFAFKSIYAEFLKSGNKKNFRNMHVSEITAYEEARDWLKDFYPDGKMLSLKSLKERKRKLQGSIDSQKTVIHNYKNHCKELETVSANVDTILRRQAMETVIIHPRTTEHQKPQKERKEESL